MSLSGFKAKNHPQQVGRRSAVDGIDDRETAPYVFDPLHARFGFTLDAAAASHNAKCERYFSREDDGLSQSWAGESVWCNPPYSDVPAWVRKAWLEQSQCRAIVMLLPANRTEQPWWQHMVEPYRDRPGSPLRVEFIAGRLRFTAPGQSRLEPNNRPPFGCCLLIWQAVTWQPDAVVGGLFGGAA